MYKASPRAALGSRAGDAHAHPGARSRRRGPRLARACPAGPRRACSRSGHARLRALPGPRRERLGVRHPHGEPAEADARGGEETRLERLERLASLHERGLLSDEELAREKARAWLGVVGFGRPYARARRGFALAGRPVRVAHAQCERVDGRWEVPTWTRCEPLVELQPLPARRAKGKRSQQPARLSREPGFSTSSERGPGYVSDRGFGTPSWRQIAATVPGRISA
jgi:hypothetical protein